MSREQLKTSCEDVVAEKNRVLQLLREALSTRSGNSSFDLLMKEASGHGLNWIEALEFVVACRRSLPRLYDPEDRRGMVVAEAPAQPSQAEEGVLSLQI